MFGLLGEQVERRRTEGGRVLAEPDRGPASAGEVAGGQFGDAWVADAVEQGRAAGRADVERETVVVEAAVQKVPPLFGRGPFPGLGCGPGPGTSRWVVRPRGVVHWRKLRTERRDGPPRPTGPRRGAG
ncbi:hypothetical protein GCM10010441_42290 [Kitasatospora paracochleata]